MRDIWKVLFCFGGVPEFSWGKLVSSIVYFNLFQSFLFIMHNLFTELTLTTVPLKDMKWLLMKLCCTCLIQTPAGWTRLKCALDKSEEIPMMYCKSFCFKLMCMCSTSDGQGKYFHIGVWIHVKYLWRLKLDNLCFFFSVLHFMNMYKSICLQLKSLHWCSMTVSCSCLMTLVC